MAGSTNDDFSDLAAEKVHFGEKLIERLISINDVDGVPKLQRKIKQEISFLKKLQSSGKVKVEQLSCSNLRHLTAVTECALRPGVKSVCKTLHYMNGRKLNVDIISRNGKTWTKVIARNPKSLSALSNGNASYGARSILDQANDYVECAKSYPCMYQTPQVVFEFTSGIEEHLARKLNLLGVKVLGDVLPTPDQNYEISDDDYTDSNSSSSDISSICSNELSNPSECPLEIDTLNLDVTAMMAFVSNLTNGYANYVFKENVLTQQAVWERENPVKPVLEELFKGNKLVCCATAWDDFMKIMNILGGDMEKSRTKELEQIITILPDNYGDNHDAMKNNLKVKGRVRLRSKIIFNFGHRIKAMTVSANDGFVRSSLQQGITYAAFIHGSRALTEKKQQSASVLENFH